MRPLDIVFIILVVAAYSNIALKNSLENNDFIAEEKPTTVRKRETESQEGSQDAFNVFIEEKLMHQSQALEHLVTAVDRSGDMIKNLIENLSKGIEKPNLPDKAQAEEVPSKNKNNNKNGSGEKENILFRLGKSIPKYTKLAKDLIMTEVGSGTDPTPLIELDTSVTILPELGTRRSFGGNPEPPNQRKVNPWCPVALLCQKTDEPLCGFDDEFGYGKFDDICHMLHVNCYWKYNFSMVNSCRPKL